MMGSNPGKSGRKSRFVIAISSMVAMVIITVLLYYYLATPDKTYTWFQGPCCSSNQPSLPVISNDPSSNIINSRQAADGFLSSAITLDSRRVQVPDNAIYFLETSGYPFLSPKHQCSIESAAQHHPTRQIVVGMKSKNVLKTSALENLLRHHANIVLVQIDLTSWLNGTILGPWLKKGLLAKSNFRVEHTSDILRLVTLFKHGGVYLDLDLLVLKPLNGGLQNAVGLQGRTLDGANNGALIFEKGHPILKSCLEGISKGYDWSSWSGNGPWLLSRVMNEWCEQPSNHSMEPMTCKGVSLLDTTAFYPVPYTQWGSLFNPDPSVANKTLSSINQSFAVHLWNKATHREPIMLNTSSAVAQIARENCPLASTDFGGELWGVAVD